MRLKVLNINIGLEAKIFVFILVLLLLFDRGFSKLAIIEPLYFHDALLVLATICSIYKFPLKIKQPSILLLLVVSALYLIYSVFFISITGGLLIMMLRHYFLFFYLWCCYIIANKFFSKPEHIDIAISFIIKISKWAVALQLLYFCYLFFTVPNYSPFKGFSYLSAVAVLGIITYSAYVMAYYNKKKRVFAFFGILCISLMLGHSSAFLSVFSVFLTNFFIFFSPKQRGIILGVIVALMLSLFLFPQFNDANVGWRLLYWKHILDVSIFDNFLIFGEGFGQPFMTEEFSFEVLKEIGSRNMAYKPLARWLSPPHNSFLTIVFHVGLIPSLLLLAPLKPVFGQLFLSPKSRDKKELFLLFSLIGSCVWISFNVVLELPHSAIYFWLIYFTYIFYESRKK